MPNWCGNALSVSGPAERIKRFELEARGDEVCFSLASLVSPPDCPEYRDEPNQSEASKSPNWWYNWNVNNWGTKWDACSPELIEREIGKESGRLVYVFDTAWAPPMEAVSAMSNNFPNLKFYLEFDEEGMELKGILLAGGGEAVSY